MNNQEYLSEERYQRNNVKVKKAGKILLMLGIFLTVISFALLIIGFVGIGNSAVNGIDSFGSAIQNNSYNPVNNDASTIDETYNNAQNAINKGITNAKNTNGGIFGNFGILMLSIPMLSIGLGLALTGGMLLLISHRREITAYTTQQVMPIAQEGINKMAPTVGNVAKEIAKGIKEGIKDDNKS